MHLEDLEARIQQMEEVLSQIADGNFERKVAIGGHDDALSSLEIGINFMLMDLRMMRKTEQEKEAQLRRQQLDLEERLQIIAEQARAIDELSTPTLEVWDKVLVLPIIGVVDAKRTTDIMNRLLESVVIRQASFAIIDVTGIKTISAQTGEYLLQIVSAAGLLGTTCLLTGINPNVAQALVELGVNLSTVKTKRDLKQGLLYCLQQLHPSERKR